MAPAHRRKSSLPLVTAGDELTGTAPAELERAAKRCNAGDVMHRGLLVVSVTLARHATRACLPPDAQPLLLTALDSAEGWAHGQLGARDVRRQRQQAFSVSATIERRALQAVHARFEQLPTGSSTPLDAHADTVVDRYLGLAAYFTTGSALLTLDAVDEPAQAVLVPQQVAGALAYQTAGLGPARSSHMRRAAWDRAQWESDRPGAATAHSPAALALQLLHEYLGSYWKTHSDAQRIRLGEFIHWAMPPSSDAGSPG